MKTISPSLTAHIQSETTTLCTLWKLTRRDGQVMTFTDHDIDVIFEGLTYSAATGYTRTAITGNAILSVDNVDLEGILSGAGLSADDIRGGLYDWAELLVSLVNYADLTMGSVILRRGRLGEFTLKDGLFTTELRGLSQALSRNFVEAFTADCRADLGDARCKVDVSAHRETGTVSSITTQRRIFAASVTGARAADYFNGGLLTWNTGANAGLKQEIKTLTSGTITLYLPSGEDISTGDAFTIQAGCDKSVSMCSLRYANIANNRSFPFIPGTDLVNRTPDARPQ